jgi:NAD(P)-dependent dehydrogenase (short-subunit alcohol dehydrogenase family)
VSAVVIGATSAIARAMVRQWASRGHLVAVAARDVAEAERIAQDASVRYGGAHVAVPFDALDFDGHKAFIEGVAERLGGIDTAIIAFGDMGEQAESEVDFAAARRVIDTNYTAAASVAEALMAVMGPRHTGTIVGLTSVAGERGRRSNYIYGSAKGAFTLYLDGLRGRAHGAGVHVLTVKLGFIDTRMTWGLGGKIPIASPDDAARAVYEAALAGTESMYYPHFWAPIMATIRAIPPSIMKRLSL